VHGECWPMSAHQNGCGIFLKALPRKQIVSRSENDQHLVGSPIHVNSLEHTVYPTKSLSI
jgi:hypothetical protein